MRHHSHLHTPQQWSSPALKARTLEKWACCCQANPPLWQPATSSLQLRWVQSAAKFYRTFKRQLNGPTTACNGAYLLSRPAQCSCTSTCTKVHVCSLDSYDRTRNDWESHRSRRAWPSALFDPVRTNGFPSTRTERVLEFCGCCYNGRVRNFSFFPCTYAFCSVLCYSK